MTTDYSTPPTEADPDLRQTYESTEARHRVSEPGAQPSIVEGLRRQRDELLEEATLDLPLPGWDGQLVIRFGRAAPERWKRLAGRITQARGSGVDEHETNQDLVLICARQVLVRSGPALIALPEPGTEHPADPPISFDERLAHTLGIEPVPATARKLLAAVMTYRGQGALPQEEAALNVMVGDLMEWLTGQRVAADEQALGE